MSRYSIAEQIRMLADQIRYEDPDTATSLNVLEGAVLEGTEDAVNELLSQYADHRIAAWRARNN